MKGKQTSICHPFKKKQVSVILSKKRSICQDEIKKQKYLSI